MLISNVVELIDRSLFCAIVGCVALSMKNIVCFKSGVLLSHYLGRANELSARYRAKPLHVLGIAMELSRSIADQHRNAD